MAQFKRPRTIDDVRRDPRVEQFFKDSDGWWCWLKPGYWSSNAECGTIHEYNIDGITAEFVYIERAPLNYINGSKPYPLAEAEANWKEVEDAMD